MLVWLSNSAGSLGTYRAACKVHLRGYGAVSYKRTADPSLIRGRFVGVTMHAYNRAVNARLPAVGVCTRNSFTLNYAVVC